MMSVQAGFLNIESLLHRTTTGAPKAARPGRQHRIVGSSPRVHHTLSTAWVSCVRDSLASPYNIEQFGFVKRGFSRPENPLPLPRFNTTTFFARSTSRIGMPAIG